jgi:hypothetical protein
MQNIFELEYAKWHQSKLRIEMILTSLLLSLFFSSRTLAPFFQMHTLEQRKKSS